MKTNDGGPAYPFSPDPQPQNPDGTWDQSWDPGESGMTMRQWYKGKALAGIDLAAITDSVSDEMLARWCGEMADAMLAEDEEHGRANDET